MRDVLLPLSPRAATFYSATEASVTRERPRIIMKCFASPRGFTGIALALLACNQSLSCCICYIFVLRYTFLHLLLAY